MYAIVLKLGDQWDNLNAKQAQAVAGRSNPPTNHHSVPSSSMKGEKYDGIFSEPPQKNVPEKNCQ